MGTSCTSHLKIVWMKPLWFNRVTSCSLDLLRYEYRSRQGGIERCRFRRQDACSADMAASLICKHDPRLECTWCSSTRPRMARIDGKRGGIKLRRS